MFPFFFYLFSFLCFVGGAHPWQFSELTPDSDLRDHSWQTQGNIWSDGDQSWFLLYYLSSLQVVFFLSGFVFRPHLGVLMIKGHHGDQGSGIAPRLLTCSSTPNYLFGPMFPFKFIYASVFKSNHFLGSGRSSMVEHLPRTWGTELKSQNKTKKKKADNEWLQVWKW